MMLMPDRIKAKKEEFRAHPELYPEVPGEVYRIVLCDSDGEPIKAGKGKIEPTNPVLRIMRLSEGLEKEFVNWDV
jgi:hypothetical protein